MYHNLRPAWCNFLKKLNKFLLDDCTRENGTDVKLKEKTKQNKRFHN